MTEKEYRSHPAISRSELAKMSESPEKFKYYKDHPEPPTPALIFGQLFHTMALQPETLAEQFAVAPNVDRRTKAGKEAFAKFEALAGDRQVVTADMYELAKEMTEALYSNPLITRLLQGEKEVPFFWTDDLTGEECKCRTDILIRNGNGITVVDLKTTENADTASFVKSALKHQYDLQAAMYSEGVKKMTGCEFVHFVFIAIEKKPPYAVNVLQCDDLVLRRGYDLFREYLGKYHECNETGVWYGFTGSFNLINEFSLPDYLAEKIK